MNHAKALIIKFAMITAILLIVMTWIFDISFVDTLLISLALTALAYMMGDLLIFLNAGKPADQDTRNAIATISDFILAFLVIWFVGQLLTGDMAQLVTPALTSALIITGGEWFFHKYMDHKVMPEYNEYKSVKGS